MSDAEFDDFIESILRNDICRVKNIFKNQYLDYFDKNGFTGFLHACNLGYTEIVKFFFQKGVNFSLTSPNGWNGLHWAAGNGYESVVIFLLENGAAKESETGKKYRPIHCATVGNHEKALRVLLTYGCDYNARNKDNKTPLEIASDLENDECRTLLKTWIEYDKIFNVAREHRLLDFTEAFLVERINVKENNSNKTVVDVAVESASLECLEHIFLQDLDPKVILTSLEFTLTRLKVSAEDFLRQFRLYHSIIFNLKDKFDEFSLVDVVNTPWILTEESFLFIAVKFNRKDMVVSILQIMLEINETLDKAVEIARLKGFVTITEIVTKRKQLVNAKEKASNNRLHLAIQDNRADVVRFILRNALVDPNECSQVVGSPLSFALLLGFGDCVKELLEHGVEVNVINKYHQTPLHIAIENGMIEYCSVLTERSNDIDKRDLFDFTALHLAVINGDDDLCRGFLNKGANVISSLKIPQEENINLKLKIALFPLLKVENPLTLSLKLHGTILPSLMEKIDLNHIRTIMEDGSTLLHLAARLLLEDTSLQLINKGAKINIQNKEGNTPTHALFKESLENSWQNEGFVETLGVLVNNGADVNLINKEGLSSFRCAFEICDKRILNVIISRCDKLDCEVEDFFFAYEKQWPDLIETMLFLQNDEFKKRLIVLSIERNMDEFIDFILESASDILREVIVEDGLFAAAKVDNEIMFNKFMSSHLKQPKVFPCGQTLLTKLILERNEKYSLKLVKAEFGEMFLDVPNQFGQTPLYLSAEMASLKVCKYLVMESHSLVYEDAHGETAMELLLRSSSNTTEKKQLERTEKILKLMIRAGFDINRVNKSKERAINLCQNINLKKKLESFNDKNSVKRPRPRNDSEDEKNICEICLSNPLSCQFGCGHPFCGSCADKVSICPKCRKPKTRKIPLYL